MPPNLYDLIIVGGGISGLRVGIESLKAKPGLRCCILEKYRYIGGRVVTFRKNIPKVGHVQWENGAGRISTSHTQVLKLLDEYKLTFIPIASETNYINEHSKEIITNKFTDLCQIYFDPISKLPSEILAKHTLKELLDKTIGQTKAKEFYELFPYYSEIHILRADLALKSFKNEMGTYENFGICKEGLSALTDAMADDFIKRGGTILLDIEVYKVVSNPDKSIHLRCKVRNTNKLLTFNSQISVLALHHSAVKKIDGVSKLSVLQYLTMTPLLRIYAIFPVKNGVSWFTGLDKIVTNSPIRYFIPMDASRGIIMISYTDGDDAKFWIKQKKSANDENVKDLVMTEIRQLFPDRTIPNPIFFKQHPWIEGCTYWLPGKYNVKEESYKSLHPMPEKCPNLFMTGESFAVHQCWIESGLEQADKLFSNDKFIHLLHNT